MWRVLKQLKMKSISQLLSSPNIPWNLIFIVLGASILILFGMNLDIIVQGKNVPEIDYKIRYSELLNWFSTLVIGFFVGYILKNQSENDKTIKSYLIDDLKKISEMVEDLKSYCFSFKSNHCFDESQRKEIDSRINQLDKRITIFCTFLKDCYENEYSSVNEILVNHHNELNRKITGEGYYDESANDSYFDDIVTESSKFENSLRRIYLKIIRKM